MDFVTFEIAKKLKDIGFECKYPFAMYNENGIFHALFTSADFYNCESGKYREYYAIEDFNEHDYICPTISQVLAWLRNEKGIHICVDICSNGWFVDITSFYKEDTGVYEYNFPYLSNDDTPDYDTYEQAVLMGISYVLDNLI